MLLQVTQKCHEMCPHCFNSSTPEGGHISFNTFEKSIEFIGKIARFLVITGGEPFLHPQIEEMVKIASKKFAAVLVATNGSFLFDNELLGVATRLMFTENKNVFLSMNQNPLYYKSNKAVEGALKDIGKSVLRVQYNNDGIEKLLCLGRAKEIFKANPSLTPKRCSCVNLYLLKKQGFSFHGALNLLETKGLICQSLINIHGHVILGEASGCQQIGYILDDMSLIEENFQKFDPLKCNLCNGASEEDFKTILEKLKKGQQ